MDFPTVSVLVVTYNRPFEVRRTIRSLSSRLKYRGDLHLHLADDNSPPGYLTGLQDDDTIPPFTTTVTDRKGWGANVNKAMVHLWDKVSDLIFLCEDDYVALKDLDLTSGVALLLSQKSLGLIRYDGIAGHKLNLQLRETKTDVGRINHMAIAHPSPHLNYYSHRPHLKHRRFHDKYGLYAEGKPLGATEEGFAHRVKDRYPKSPKIAVLQDGIVRAFDHIGKSRQGTPEDVHGT